MQQTASHATTSSARSAPATFRDVLAGLVGHVVTIVNPESMEEAPLGRRITASFYRAKVLSLDGDCLTLATELVHHGAKKDREPVKQFLPVERVKRVSLLRSERMIHL